MNKQYFYILLALIVITVFGIIIYKSTSKKVIDNNPPALVEPAIKDVVVRLAASEIAHTDTSTWKEYTSSKLGVKFKYPPTLFVFEGEIKLYGTYLIRIYEDTPDNHYYVKNMDNLDSEAETLNIIRISATPLVGDFITSDFMKNSDPSTKWEEIVFKGNKAIAEVGIASMLGSDYPYDGLTVATNEKLFKFSVPHWPDPKQTTRDDYYKILSTVEFIK